MFVRKEIHALYPLLPWKTNDVVGKARGFENVSRA